MIRAIFVDLDGVLRLWNDDLVAQTEVVVGLPPGSFAPVAFEPELLRRAVTGRISDEEWRAEAEGRLQARYPDADVARVIHVWSSAVGYVNNELLDILRLCRRRLPISLITNATSRLHHDLKQLQLTDEFDHIFNTSELGVAKPDTAVFQIALDRVGVEAEQSVFIDDHPANVRSATELGMHAHLYENVQSVRAFLGELGMLN